IRREKFSAATTRPSQRVSRHRDISRSIQAAFLESSADKADYTRAGKRTDDAQVAPASWQISLKSETHPARSANPCPRKALPPATRRGWHPVFRSRQSQRCLRFGV